KTTKIKKQPDPCYTTDMQAQMTIGKIKAKGTSVVNETVFENRFMHLEEMRKMNAHCIIDGQSAIINGGNTLEGAEVASTDLRASAALILAGIITEGHTRVTAINHIDRGYYKLH